MSKHSQKDNKGRYFNPHIGNIHRRVQDFFLWMLGCFRDLPFDLVPEGFSYPLPNLEFDPAKPWVKWIGHSTFLIQLGNKHILTDPIWSKRCSPLCFLGPKRKHPPAVAIQDLPNIDYVLISHDHYDHLDRFTIEQLHTRFPHILWIVPKGVKAWFERLGISRVIELDWWEEIGIDSIFRITAVPAQHFSGRRSPHLNKTLWVGYVLEELLSDKCLYFVGDTGYNPIDFKKIGEQFPKVDLSLIPIGAYSPRKFMAPVHVEPKDAVCIHKDVNSKLSIGMHWKTFRLAEEPMEQPPFDLLKALKKENIDPSTFLAIEPGEEVNW